MGARLQAWGTTEGVMSGFLPGSLLQDGSSSARLDTALGRDPAVIQAGHGFGWRPGGHPGPAARAAWLPALPSGPRMLSTSPGCPECWRKAGQGLGRRQG